MLRNTAFHWKSHKKIVLVFDLSYNVHMFYLKCRLYMLKSKLKEWKTVNISQLIFSLFNDEGNWHFAPLCKALELILDGLRANLATWHFVFTGSITAGNFFFNSPWSFFFKFFFSFLYLSLLRQYWKGIHFGENTAIVH